MRHYLSYRHPLKFFGFSFLINSNLERSNTYNRRYNIIIAEQLNIIEWVITKLTYILWFSFISHSLCLGMDIPNPIHLNCCSDMNCNNLDFSNKSILGIIIVSIKKCGILLLKKTTLHPSQYSGLQ